MSAVWLNLFCVGGGEHNYVPTGKSWKRWTSNSTDSKPPADGPEFEEVRCVICGDEKVRPKREDA